MCFAERKGSEKALRKGSKKGLSSRHLLFYMHALYTPSLPTGVINS